MTIGDFIFAINVAFLAPFLLGYILLSAFTIINDMI